MIKDMHGNTIGKRVDVWLDGHWQENGGRTAIDPAANGFWLGMTVFDGARAFDGVAPDLDRHCARVVRSAELIGLNPFIEAAEIERLAREGIQRFDPGTALYICPVFTGDCMAVITDNDDTRFLLMVREAPMPEMTGFSAGATPQRRPARDMAPTDAKASCLYPNVIRGMRSAQARGFDQGVVLDPNGNVAEFSFQNLFMVKDGVVHTPVTNGTFLNGITRQRVIALLRDDGLTVEERTIDFEELLSADETFATGNYAKIKPCTRIEDHEMPIGEVSRRARDLYWNWAARQNA